MSFVAAEIDSQPDCWLRAAKLARASAVADALPQADARVAVVGCGTSLYMAQSASCRGRGGTPRPPCMCRSMSLGSNHAHPGLQSSPGGGVPGPTAGMAPAST